MSGQENDGGKRASGNSRVSGFRPGLAMGHVIGYGIRGMESFRRRGQALESFRLLRCKLNAEMQAEKSVKSRTLAGALVSHISIFLALNYFEEKPSTG